MTDAWQRLAGELDRWAPGDGELLVARRRRGRAQPRPRPAARPRVPAARACRDPGRDGAGAGGLSRRPRQVDVLQHGYAHRNHEPPDGQEGGAGRRPPRCCGAARSSRRGARLLAAAFGTQALPVLVPPWNRIAEPVIDLLAGEGYRGLSTQGLQPPEAASWRRGILQVNTHVDIVDWRGGRGFIGREAAIDLTVGHLAARREGRAAAAEPTGLLTHHLVLEDAAFDFTAEFLARTAEHPAVQWRSARDIFAPGIGFAAA